MVSFEMKIDLRKIKLLGYFWLLSFISENIIQSMVFELPTSYRKWPCDSIDIPLIRRSQLTY